MGKKLHSRELSPNLARLLLVAAVAVAYANSFWGDFVFDDLLSIRDNESIRSLGNLPAVLSPPGGGATVDGRPLLNLSFAINYAIGGTEVTGYHLTNLAIHLAAALTLFGLIRRTLLLPGWPPPWQASATMLALAVSLLWAIHPLQTESVTYIVQRAESLAGLLLLLTLSCFLRGAEPPQQGQAPPSRGWYAASIACCALGMAAKEIVVAAPVLALLYDRAFLAGSFREAIRLRWNVYTGLCACWLLLALLVWRSAGRGGTAGFGEEVHPWRYALTQLPAIANYLRLCFWPRPLVMDYGDGLVEPGWWLLPYGLLIAGLVAATLFALWRWPKLGFVGAWFWCLLAPTSSVVPVITQTAAEHRMYLPLAAVVVLTVVGVGAAWSWLAKPRPSRKSAAWSGAATIAVAAAAATLGLLTWQRNHDYRTRLSIWLDTANKRPDNARALASVGDELFEAGDLPAAIDYVGRAIALKPNDARLLCGRADMLKHFSAELHARGTEKAASELLSKSLEDYVAALRIDPLSADLWYKRAIAHHRMGTSRPTELPAALEAYTKALALRPDWPEALNNRADAHLKLRDYDAAWADVERMRALGAEPVPAMLQNLVRQSGRQDIPRTTTAQP